MNHSANYNTTTPLAERSRPLALKDFIGHEYITGDGKLIKSAMDSARIFSIIFWGGPGSGKTTLAKIISESSGVESFFLSAISSGVADVRKVLDIGKKNRVSGMQTILFLDEIHRFNKAQQDAVLGAVESGDVVLIGATTENPSFSVISPLLSRVRVIKLSNHSDKDLLAIMANALDRDQVINRDTVVFDEGVRERIAALSGGDARRMLNILETAFYLSKDGKISMEILKDAMESSLLYYDRAGDRHYDTISAFIKSMRGSDPDAAVYYLAKMLIAGEDPEFIARRMIIFASEDVGNASPHALPIAVASLTAVQNIGMPESEIILSQCAVFLASSPKSNASYLAIVKAKETAGQSNYEIPMHIRNAPTGLMKKMGYGRDYKYPHDHEGHFVEDSYLPAEIKDQKFYSPSEEGSEKGILERLRRLWPGRY